MIFDTDVLIWVQRGRIESANMINSDSERKISIVSYMEFIQSARDKKMLAKCKKFLEELDLEILQVTPNISHRATVFIEQFSLSHGLSIPDAFVAATAFEHGMPLGTSNHKDYKMIKGLEIVRLRVH